MESGSHTPEFVLRTARGDIAAGEPAHVIAALIDGYPAEEEARLAARLAHATAAKLRLTARLLAANRGPTPTPDQLTVLTASGWDPPELDVWRCCVPLILLDVWYQPFTETPRPRGSIFWLCPSRELPYLRSLVAAGEIELEQRP
ncbi:MAG: hypothetical protein ACRDTD_20385 [Pseudonocardiaceae bacterium]